MRIATSSEPRCDCTAFTPIPESPVTLDRFSIVYFGNDWFAENRTSSHHIARLLSQRNRLLYVETPGMRAPGATKRDLTKLHQKLRRSLQPVQKIQENLWLLTVPQIPFRRLPLTRQFNRFYGRYAVQRAIRQLKFEQVILWFTVPHPGPLAGTLGERFVVYYCVDDYAYLTGVDGREIARLDEELTRSADQVFATSSHLCERKKQHNANTAYSPHGVDFAHFSAASDSAAPVALGARDLPHPIIGFFGSIGRFVDIELLVSIARSRPDWTLLFIGLPAVDVQELRACKNAVFAGAQPYKDLPDWARAFDVAILPYRSSDPGVVNANPLKLREYLATGKPVVASSTPATEPFAHCIHIARNAGEFIEKIEAALALDSDASRQRRMQEVIGCSWESRVDEIVEVVEANISKKIVAAHN